MPNTVPILSASANRKGLFQPTAHGHLGLTIAVTVARLMEELIPRATLAFGVHPYRVDRF